MANRRMFSKTVVQSSKFLRMPATSRLLYYDFGMAADDDGYCEWFTTLQMTGAKEQDMQVLEANGFLKIFDREVLLLLDWKENNLIKADRYTPSKYLDKYDGFQSGTQVEPQVRLGKVRLGEVTIVDEEAKKPKKRTNSTDTFVRLFREVNPFWQRLLIRPADLDAVPMLLEEHPMEWWAEFMPKYAEAIRNDKYMPKATSPSQMLEKLPNIQANIQAKLSSKKVKII